MMNKTRGAQARYFTEQGFIAATSIFLALAAFGPGGAGKMHANDKLIGERAAMPAPV